MPGIDFMHLRQQVSLTHLLDLVGFKATTRRGPQVRGPSGRAGPGLDWEPGKRGRLPYGAAIPRCFHASAAFLILPCGRSLERGKLPTSPVLIGRPHGVRGLLTYLAHEAENLDDLRTRFLHKSSVSGSGNAVLAL